MPDRIETFRVLIGQEPLGFIRLERTRSTTRWVARTLGSEDTAASIRRFTDRYLACQWLANETP